MPPEERLPLSHFTQACDLGPCTSNCFDTQINTLQKFGAMAGGYPMCDGCALKFKELVALSGPTLEDVLGYFGLEEEL